MPVNSVLHHLRRCVVKRGRAGSATTLRACVAALLGMNRVQRMPQQCPDALVLKLGRVGFRHGDNGAAPDMALDLLADLALKQGLKAGCPGRGSELPQDVKNRRVFQKINGLTTGMGKLRTAFALFRIWLERQFLAKTITFTSLGAIHLEFTDIGYI
jgi:hypothetical protein